MKKIVIIALALFATNLSVAQSQYEKGMQKAFDLWSEGKNLEASNLFERISMAEPDNWLPYYYVSTINTLIAFGEKDEEKLSQKLEKAKEFIAIAKRISPNNPEILIQEALINTAWIAFDGATYGMTLSGKNTQLYKEALTIAPNNPRVILSKAEWDMGSARFFGKDITPYCKDVEKALELFGTFKAPEKFYPTYGKERAEQIIAECKAE